MKRFTFLYIQATSLLLVLSAACSSKSETTESVAAVEASNRIARLEQANNKYIQEVEDYRVDMQVQINNNKLLFIKLKENGILAKKAGPAGWKATIDSLEKQNREMETRIHRFPDTENKDQWFQFKIKFDRGMEELKKATKKLQKDPVN